MSELTEEQQNELRRMLRDQNVFEMSKIIPTLPPDMLDAACTQLKLQGNHFFHKKEYARAIEAYNGALAGMPNEAAIYSNRAVCYMKEREYDKSLADAEMCIKLNPQWSKGWYRYGHTLMFMEKYEDSVAYFKKANELEPDNQEIRRCLREAEGLEYNQRATLANTMGQPIPKQPVRRQQVKPPKFDPEMLNKKLDLTDEWYKDSDNAKGLVVFMQNSDLIWNFPKRLVEFLDDRVLVHAWETAIEKTLNGDWFVPPDVEVGVEVKSNMPGVLLFGSYLGYLLMSSVDKGVTDIELVEPAPFFTRKVRDVLLDNYPKEKAHHILQETKLSVRDPLQLTTRDVPGKFDVLMCAMDSNHDYFSSLVIQQIEKAKVEFLRPNHRIMPCRVQVYGVLIEWDENFASEGVDMKRVDEFRWNLVNDFCEVHNQNFKVLTEETLVCDLNLQEAALIRPFDSKISMTATQDGRMQGILTWLVIHIAEGVTVSNSPFIDPALQSTFRLPTFQYFDPQPVVTGVPVEVLVHFNLSKLWFESVPRSTIVRHHMIPSWYFEMLHDRPRNERYKQAVEAIINEWIDQNPSKAVCNVLDVGSGLGLLSTFAARVNPKVQVTAVESIRHIADASKQIFHDNGVQNQVRIVHKDARTLTNKDIPSLVDVLLFEVFDAGLIGEGIVHFLEPLRNNVVAKGVRVLPMSAKVYAMVIELRTSQVGNYAMEQVNSFRFRPEYFNMDLMKLEHRILSEPFEVFEFDFQHQYRREFIKIEPTSKLFEVEITEDGVASAVAFWWDLNLTEDITLSTSPFEDYSAHWKQAIQYIPEIRCEQGAKLPLIGSHNTFGITFTLHPDRCTLREGITVITKPPRIDPELEKMHDKLKKLQDEFYKIMTNEKSFLETRSAVSRLALQPGLFGVNPEIMARLVRSFFG